MTGSRRRFSFFPGMRNGKRRSAVSHFLYYTNFELEHLTLEKR